MRTQPPQLTPLSQPPIAVEQQDNVQNHVCREMAIVMMKTTMLLATGTEETAVQAQTATQTEMPIAQPAPALILMEDNVHNQLGIKTAIVTMTTTMLLATGTEETVVQAQTPTQTDMPIAQPAPALILMLE